MFTAVLFTLVKKIGNHPKAHQNDNQGYCCCGWCAELHGSKSWLHPFPATVRKWMFKEDHLREHRCMESVKIWAKYPDWVLVIVKKVSGSQIVDNDKWKYLVPSDITVDDQEKDPARQSSCLWVKQSHSPAYLWEKEKMKMDSCMWPTVERTFLTSEGHWWARCTVPACTSCK